MGRPGTDGEYHGDSVCLKEAENETYKNSSNDGRSGRRGGIDSFGSSLNLCHGHRDRRCRHIYHNSGSVRRYWFPDGRLHRGRELDRRAYRSADFRQGSQGKHWSSGSRAVHFPSGFRMVWKWATTGCLIYCTDGGVPPLNAAARRVMVTSPCKCRVGEEDAGCRQVKDNKKRRHHNTAEDA